MTADAFERRTELLAAGVRRTPGLTGLILLGSASGEGAARRDEWSDHDFFVLTEPGRGAELRGNLSWLPDTETAARNLFDLVRRGLEPGWDDFPTAAADAVAAHLGYDATG